MAFTIDADFEIAHVRQQLKNIIRKAETKSEAALELLARSSVNESKRKDRQGAWQDQTGNLRASISHFLVREGFTKSSAVVFAGMEYAIFVHFKSGYAVLVPPEQNIIDKVKQSLSLI